jgi:hypothetical protein
MKKSLVVTLLLAALAGCQSRPNVACKATPWPLRSHSGFIMDTPHYRIYTTVKDKDFHTAAANLAEGQYARFRQAIHREPKEKMTVYIFSDVNQWIAFTEATFPDQAAEYLRIRNGGYAAGRLAAFYYLGRYSTLTVMAHELFHLYVDQACREPIPAWINEGLSTYFEAHEWDGMQPVYTPRKNLFRQGNLSQAVSRKKLFPLKELLETHAGEVGKLPQGRVLTYYAQLWALMEYLQDPASGKYHTNFIKLLTEMGTREMNLKARGFLATIRIDDKVSFGEAVFREYITNDLTRFNNDFEAYCLQILGW